MEKKQPTPRFDREKLATVNCFLRLIDKNPVPVARPPSRLRPDAADAGRPSVVASAAAAAAAVLASGSANGNDDVSSKQIDRRPTLSRGDLAISARRTAVSTLATRGATCTNTERLNGNWPDFHRIHHRIHRNHHRSRQWYGMVW